MKHIIKIISIAIFVSIFQLSVAQKSNKIKDNGITNPLHQKYQGKIVFSKTVIMKDEATEAGFVKEFSIKEDIFFRVYMKESIYNALCDSGYSTSFLDRDSEYRIVIKMDNDVSFERTLYLRNLMSDDEKKKFTTFRGCFRKDEGEIGVVDWKYFIEEKQQNITTGKHTIKIELFARGRNDKANYRGIPVASGDFMLNVPANFIDPNDPSVCLPKATKKDPAMEAKMLAAINLRNKADGYNIEVTKVIIKSNDWTIEKNEYTHKIIRRWMEAYVAGKENGKCTYENIVFSQDYEGSGFQNKIYASSIGGPKNVHCDCLKVK